MLLQLVYRVIVEVVLDYYQYYRYIYCVIDPFDLLTCTHIQVYLYVYKVRVQVHST